MNKTGPGRDSPDGSGAIAIIGLAGRFPGARDVAQFWQNLKNGVESITHFSEKELREAGVSAEVLNDPRYVRAAPLLEDVDCFDAAFFDYSPREAQLLDPQQRLFLEGAWEALESAGYDPQNMPVPVGVYGGAGGLVTSYFLAQMASSPRHCGRTASLAHIANDKDFLTTRVSYKLNLRGPSLDVQTACSTSLVAVHLACQSLLCHECDVALAGGVTVRVPVQAGYIYEEGGIVSPDGHCRPFDAAARGTIFGSGVGIVVLKRLAEALADGDPIRAVIKGSAINNDGGTKLSFTATSETGQANAIAEALAVADCAPETVSCIEAHGTATALGDPVEVSALTKVFRRPGQEMGSCALGSVKSNIGHLEAAAGIAGLIKMVLALEHRQIPPSLHFEKPNPRIDFAKSPFAVNAQLRDWPAGATPRRAGVNALGVGGTNAFVVLEEAPARPAAGIPSALELFCLSAKSESALERLVERYVSHLDAHPGQSLGDLCYTVAFGRTLFAERLAVVADSCASLRRQLAEARAGGLLRGHAATSASDEVAARPSFTGPVEELRRGLTTLGVQWVRGVKVDWTEFFHGRHLRRAILPAYPFERARHWLEPDAASPSGWEPNLAHTPFPGRRLSSPLADIQYEIQLGVPSWPVLADHRVYGEIVVPGAWHLAMVLASAREVLGAGSILLRGILFPRALALGETEVRSAQVIFRPGERETAFQVWSRPALDTAPAAPWLRHAQGEVIVEPPAGQDAEILRPREVEERCRETIPLADFYRRMHDRQIDLGPGFQWNARVSSNEAETLSRIFPPITETGEFLLHPGLLDSCVQLVIARLPPTYLPLSIDQLRFDPRLASPSWIHARFRPTGEADPELRIADVRIVDEEGRAILEMEGLTVKRATPSALLGEAETRGVESWFYELQWRPSPPAESELALDGNGNWLVFLDRSGVGEALAELLEKHGQRCVRVVAAAESGAGESAWRLDPREPAGFRRLLREALGTEGSNEGWRGIIYLWGVDAAPPENDHADACCAPVLSLVQELAALGSGAPRLWLVTRGVQAIHSEPVPAAVAQAPLWGLGRVIATEHPAFHCTLVDLDPVRAGDDARSLFAELLSGDAEEQLAYRDRQRYVARLARLAAPAQDRASSRLRIPTRGVLSDLQLQPAERRAPAVGEVEIRVHAAGLNFRDVLNALGTYPGDAGELGLECAGTISAIGPGVEHLRVGDEVMAIALGAFSAFVTTPASLVIRKPARLSMEDAATIPVAFLTAHYALNHLARLSANQRVLIHAATGGVGLAAVQLARRARAEVFATAGSPEKQAYLRSLGVAHIMHSRTVEFADAVRTSTAGQGVDVVLNSLTGDFIPAGLSTLRRGGHFIELGKIGIWPPEQVAAARPDAAYSTVALDHMFTEQPALVARMLRELSAAFETGELQPLPRHSFPLPEAAQAFRFMAQAKHIGKIVFTLPVPPAEERRLEPPIRSDGTYLITGGLGALGLRAARWLAGQGARHLVLIGRRAPSSAAREIIGELMSAGVQVRTAQTDVAHAQSLAALFADVAATMPPLRGVIHAAGVLDDGVLHQQTPERFATAMRPKIAGAWNLHTLTRDCPLDFFVLFSSVASVLGPGGQGNYAAANAFLDALAHFRRARHLPALSLDWGPWAEAGMAAALGETGWQRFAAIGIEPIPVEQGFEALGRLLRDLRTQVIVLPIDWSKYLRQFEGREPSLCRDLATRTPARRAATAPLAAPRLRPLEGESPAQLRARVSKLVEKHTREILGWDDSKPLDFTRPLNHLGLDSMLAVELLNALSKSSGRQLPTSLVFNQPTIDAVTDGLIKCVTSASDP